QIRSSPQKQGSAEGAALFWRRQRIGIRTREGVAVKNGFSRSASSVRLNISKSPSQACDYMGSSRLGTVWIRDLKPPDAMRSLTAGIVQPLQEEEFGFQRISDHQNLEDPFLDICDPGFGSFR
ncbi:MAG: hypothetical protein IJ109_04965, partial [Firmicutes bacterium]|nr:hypothetical protein [Bacillota bacterium]